MSILFKQKLKYLVSQISQDPQDCKSVQSIGAYCQKYKLWIKETEDKLSSSRMEQIGIFWVNPTAVPQDNLKFLAWKADIYPTFTFKHPLDCSHFCKLVSICSNFVYHWFRDNLDQTLAGYSDSNLPHYSPYGRHLLYQKSTWVVDDWVRTQLSCHSFYWTLLGLGTVNLRDFYLLHWPKNLSSQRILVLLFPQFGIGKCL